MAGSPLEFQLTLIEFCRAASVSEAEMRAWIVEGVIEAAGERPEEWRFTSDALHRARTALRLSHDLEVNPAGIALALELLEEIASLRARLEGVRLSNDNPPVVLE